MTKWQYNKELLPSRAGKNEFPFGEKGIVFCSDCHSIYDQKSWHHSKQEKIKKSKINFMPGLPDD